MKITFILFASMLITFNFWSQNVAINATGASAATSAALDVDMVNKGVLIPRVALVNTSSFAPVTGTPVTSLLVYNTVASGTIPTNVFPGYYYWDGSKWVRLLSAGGGSAWELVGNWGTNPTNNFLGTTDNVDFVIRTNNAERIRVKDNGYVGIGTTAPSCLFHLNSPSNTTNVYQTFSKGNVIYSDLGVAGNVNAGILGTLVNDTWFKASNGNLWLGTTLTNDINFATTNTRRMIINSSGNVGIGTTTPSSLLHLNSAGNNTTVAQTFAKGNVMYSDLGVAGNVNAGILGTLVNDTWFKAFNGDLWLGTTSANDIHFATNSAERMTVLTNGNVGIGTTAPTSKFEVQSSNNPVGIFQYNGPVVTTDEVVLTLRIPSYSPSPFSACADFMDFETASGNIMGGINGTSVSYAVSYATTSDERLKENIVATHYGLKDLMKINVNDYNYKDFNQKTTGFIAQQLYSVYPDAVVVGGENAKTNPWMVDYGKVTPLLVKSIQDQQQIIDQQSYQINLLNEQVKVLIAELEKIKSAVAH